MKITDLFKAADLAEGFLRSIQALETMLGEEITEADIAAMLAASASSKGKVKP